MITYVREKASTRHTLVVFVQPFFTFSLFPNLIFSPFKSKATLRPSEGLKLRDANKYFAILNSLIPRAETLLRRVLSFYSLQGHCHESFVLGKQEVFFDTLDRIAKHPFDLTTESESNKSTKLLHRGVENKICLIDGRVRFDPGWIMRRRLVDK